ncbi:MAG: hypothetical protein IH968_18530 [Gemmatimonadetes bacterium]|nr:hypothetical protein [Gemmatimonadota bacterium]
MVTEVASGPFACALARIHGDDAAMGRVRNKVYTQEIYLRELIQLQTLADSVLTLIEGSLH